MISIARFISTSWRRRNQGSAFRLPWVQGIPGLFLSGQTVVVQNRLAEFGWGPARRAITDRRLAECDRSRPPSALRLSGLPVDLLNQVLAELSESPGRAVVPGRQTVPLQSSEPGSEDRAKLRSHLYDPESGHFRRPIDHTFGSSGRPPLRKASWW